MFTRPYIHCDVLNPITNLGVRQNDFESYDDYCAEIRRRRAEEQLHGARSAREGREPEGADHRHRLHVFPTDDRHQRYHILHETRVRDCGKRHQPRSFHDRCRHHTGT